ncbi:MAG: hypothetical protein WCI21_06425 [Alphaproteobacteria bacterium]
MAERTPIGRKTYGQLHDELAQLGAGLMARALGALERGTIEAQPQAADGVTYAKKVKAEEARIHWGHPAAQVDRQIRGLSPFPGAWFEIHSPRGLVRVKALISRAEEGSGPPGTVLDENLLIACGDGAVRLIKAQREGKAAQGAADFLRGFPLKAGDRVS